MSENGDFFAAGEFDFSGSRYWFIKRASSIEWHVCALTEKGHQLHSKRVGTLINAMNGS